MSVPRTGSTIKHDADLTVSAEPRRLNELVTVDGTRNTDRRKSRWSVPARQDRIRSVCSSTAEYRLSLRCQTASAVAADARCGFERPLATHTHTTPVSVTAYS